MKNNFTELPLAKAFRLIEPGPVVLVTTAQNNHPNIMTMSWHMLVDFTPQIACAIGSWDYTCDTLRATKECVLSIPTADLAGTTVDIGNCSGRDVDKFKKFHLTPMPAEQVGAPLIRECLANLECRVVDTIPKYDLFIVECIKAWIDLKRKERRTFHANGNGTFVVDGRTLNLKKKMTKWVSHTLD